MARENLKQLPVTNIAKLCTTTTERKIGRIIYQVVASHSETATDTAKQKIEKLIERECARLVK